MDTNNTSPRLWLALTFVLLLVCTFVYAELAKAIRPYMSFLTQYWWMPSPSLIASQILAIPFGLLFAFLSLKLSPWKLNDLTPAAAKKRRLRACLSAIAVFSAMPWLFFGLIYGLVFITEFATKSLHIPPDLFSIALLGIPVLGFAIYGLVKKSAFAIAAAICMPTWWLLDMAIEKWFGQHSYVSTVILFAFMFVYPRLEALIKRYWKKSH